MLDKYILALKRLMMIRSFIRSENKLGYVGSHRMSSNGESLAIIAPYDVLQWLDHVGFARDEKINNKNIKPFPPKNFFQRFNRVKSSFNK